MSTATTTRPSPRTPWASHSPRTMPSATPHSLTSRTPRTPGPAGQAVPPRQSAVTPPSRRSQDAPAPSPNYFELVANPGSNPADSNVGGHANMNWSPTAADTSQAVRFPSMTNPLESQTRSELFRRQSQTSTFRLGHGNLSHFSQSSKYGQSPPLEKPRDRREGATPPILQKSTSHIESEGRQGQDGMDIDSQSTRRLCSNDGSPSFLGIPPNQSPSETPPLDLSRMQADRAHFLDEGHRPNSLPHITTVTSSPGPSQRVVQRAETLPVSLNGSGPTMISPQELVDVMNSHVDMLLLDLRVFPQFSLSRISGAINLCIPTTLLKRPSFNVQKLTETFTKENERAKFSGWKEAQVIAVYDAHSTQLKDAVSSVNTLKKFTNENWHGSTVVLRGGFSEFSKKFPDMVDKRTTSEMESPGSGKLAIDPLVPTAAPVAGGCVMPVSQTAVNPFFGNIRQNMDLIGGVGQMAIKLPSAIKENVSIALPTWLKRATSEKDNGKIVADCFLSIEKDEQQRMQKALSTNVSYGTPSPSSTQCIQIAGFEKGVKNRYKDMLPFDHSRVRLKNVQPGSCDYINASHIKPQWSHRHYIATQAPVPTTFQDFWRLTWEQDARVIVMLTAESEGGQRKCHPYWIPGDYGSFKIKCLSERRASLESPKRTSSNGFVSSSQDIGTKRPGMDRRRSTHNSSIGKKDFPREQSPASFLDSEVPYVIIRKLALTLTTHPFEHMREITQLQYSSWPDFGAPTDPTHVLGLVEHCGAVIRNYDQAKGSSFGAANAPARNGERPIVVHCSAGCGRTGTFCTIDSVIDMLKQQRLNDFKVGSDDEKIDISMKMDVDSEGAGDEIRDWISRDDVDLVAHTVAAFRLQRLSMVQTLRQFVLCYESVLEWLSREIAEGKVAGSAKKAFRA